MPFLLPIAPGNATSIELTSSKALIGSNATTCDVALPVDSGTLELHALLNVASDAASATLVPFSASAAGACFVNGRVVPSDGAKVVHGDRIAFGQQKIAYIFSLTNEATPNDSKISSKRSFRRTLDSLRGDRAPDVSIKGGVQRSASMAASRSKERLERFLLDASTDSLLSDYVERKLRTSKASEDRRRPIVMEPPPSLSASTVSSLQSSIADSILDRSAMEAIGPRGEQALGFTQQLLSTAERNYAEIEKLRLSQRLREVNNVLNGHLEFRSSYLSTPRHSTEGTSSMRYSSPLKARQSRHDPSHKDVGGEGSDDDVEDHSDEELPAMAERPAVKVAAGNPKRIQPVSSSVPRIWRSLQDDSVSASLASRDAATRGSVEVTSTEAASKENDDAAVDDSLPSFSEAIHGKKPLDPTAASIVNPTQVTGSAVLPTAPEEPMPRIRTRTQLHQQLIDRTVQRVRREILGEGFVRWRRGLQVQEQRRRERAKQVQLLDKRLALLRRNHCFIRWRELTDRRQQVLQCRVDAFDSRQRVRWLRDLWTKWRLYIIGNQRVTRQLIRVLRLYGNGRLRLGFHKWRAWTLSTSLMAVREEATLIHSSLMERRMEHIASSHYVRHILLPSVARSFRAWRSMARRQMEKKKVLKRILQLTFRKQQTRAWTTWKQHTALVNCSMVLSERLRGELEMTQTTAQQQYVSKLNQARSEHERHVHELQSALDQQQQTLQAIEAERAAAKKAAASVKAASQAQWEHSLTRMLETSIAEADTQINHVSSELERLLQTMDTDAKAARVQAATLLIEMMLEQKMHCANERVRGQEAIFSAQERVTETSRASNPIPERQKDSWALPLSKNARYLSGMLQQRQARLHQLNQALAKLASTVRDDAGMATPDPAKLKHALFLAEAMAQRAVDHVERMITLLRRRCDLGAIAGQSGSEPAARKY